MSGRRPALSDGPNRPHPRSLAPAAGPPSGGSAEELPPERSFYCRGCKASMYGRWIPAGWYMLERAVGGRGKHRRLGLYCSLECLAAAASTVLDDGEDTHNQGIGVAGDPRRDRARTVTRAQVLLDRGASVRQAAQHLEVETKTLRHWLTAAGTPPDPAIAGKPPVSAVNELAQAGHLARVSYRVEAIGPGPQDGFRATVTAAVLAGGSDGGQRAITATGDGPSKNAARTVAAAALLAQLPD